MRPWTVATLERACRRELLSHGCIVRLALLNGKEAAYIEWTDTRAQVVVDWHEVGLKPTVIHETLHRVLDPDLDGVDRELEEAVVLAWENIVLAYINRRRRLLLAWRNALNRKARKGKPREIA